MTTRIRRALLSRQPARQTRLAPGRPQAQDAAFAIAGGHPHFNGATGVTQPITAGGSGFDVVGAGDGLVLRCPDGGWARIDISEDWSGPSTIDMLVFIRGLDANYGGIFSKNQTGTTGQINVGRFGTGNTWYIGNSDGAVEMPSTSISGSLNRWTWISVTIANAAANPTVQWYQDGALVQEITTPTLPVQPVGNGPLLLGVARDSTAAYDSDVDFAYFAFTPRVKTAEEIARTHRNVWAGFRGSRRLWPVSAGATTYTLSSPTYVPGSITSTGLTARVTVTAA